MHQEVCSNCFGGGAGPKKAIAKSFAWQRAEETGSLGFGSPAEKAPIHPMILIVGLLV